MLKMSGVWFHTILSAVAVCTLKMSGGWFHTVLGAVAVCTLKMSGVWFHTILSAVAVCILQNRWDEPATRRRSSFDFPAVGVTPPILLVFVDYSTSWFLAPIQQAPDVAAFCCYCWWWW